MEDKSKAWNEADRLIEFADQLRVCEEYTWDLILKDISTEEIKYLLSDGLLSIPAIVDANKLHFEDIMVSRLRAKRIKEQLSAYLH